MKENNIYLTKEETALIMTFINEVRDNIDTKELQKVIDNLGLKIAILGIEYLKEELK